MACAPAERPLIGVGVAVFRDDKVALIRRAHPPRRGSWSLPGGHQEQGECVRTTALREVFEETGLSVTLLGLLDIVDAIHRDGGGRVLWHYTIIDFLAIWMRGTLRNDEDSSDSVWAEPDRLEQYALSSDIRRIIALGRAQIASFS